MLALKFLCLEHIWCQSRYAPICTLPLLNTVCVFHVTQSMIMCNTPNNKLLCPISNAESYNNYSIHVIEVYDTKV